jgi:peptide/nickel transport system permease protein
MLGFIARRLALAIVTLLLLSVIVFVITNVLPQDVGRSILGPFAPQESVDALNKRLGTDRPRLEQYLDLLKGMVTFDFGESYQSGRPVGEMITETLRNSTKLALLALALTVPLGIVA